MMGLSSQFLYVIQYHKYTYQHTLPKMKLCGLSYLILDNQTLIQSDFLLPMSMQPYTAIENALS